MSALTPESFSRAALKPWVKVSNMGAEHSATGLCWSACGPESGDVMAIQVEAQIAGSVWKIETQVGAQVAPEDVLIVLESMKMEIPIEAPCAGRVVEIRVREGESIEEGTVLAVID
ncbi:MAG: acetyl-CoA carboxylase biotin carboxyl carrier protein subunit [Myxococcales bacterium]|nr:acetyl-CoA carboxylase biotin carboxyl carrier protein subunit [Myxococcales bacterium]MDH5565893.1 acetyl-CoA carboxylase biotin carboxyl carrier protein subunit [Myxococcales bacterium]